MSTSIRIPKGSAIELEGMAVVILPPGATSTGDVLCGPPKLCAAITHDPGMSWPDAAGCQLAQAAIQDGGFVALQFNRISEAARCKRRLEKGRAA